jgi:hypothetical protein
MIKKRGLVFLLAIVFIIPAMAQRVYAHNE